MISQLTVPIPDSLQSNVHVTLYDPSCIHSRLRLIKATNQEEGMDGQKSSTVNTTKDRMLRTERASEPQQSPGVGDRDHSYISWVV